MVAPTVRALLAGCGLTPVDARVLMMHALGVNRAWLISHDDDALTETQALAFSALAERRLAGEPVAYLLGEREFMGHRFVVSPSVLIPRPETELLVDTALEFLSGRREAQMLDMGTGSGAIAVAIALAAPHARVYATDLSADALSVAKENATALGAAVVFAQGSWYEALNLAGLPAVYDLIVSNPPYIHKDDAHLDQGDLRFEPRSALTDAQDGLQALRAIVTGAKPHLREGGALWMEHGWDQAPAVREMLADAGFSRIESRRDIAGIERISGGYL